MGKYANVERFCRALGYHGICPEGLTIMQKVFSFLDEEVQDEYRECIKDLEAMFAPVNKDD